MKTGLTSPEVRRRLAKFGPNQLAEKKTTAWPKILLSQLKSPLIYILLIAGLTTIFLGDYTDAIVILAAVLLNTGLGFYQEQKAQKALEALRQLLASKAKVVRDGQQKEIDTREIVPGDLVILTIGARVPADGVLIEAKDFSLNEAILTGESLPVEKKAAELTELTERQRVFMGTIVVTGIAKMVVAQTGMATQMGQIGKRVGEVEEGKTPLQMQLGKLAKILALVVAVFTVLIFATGALLSYEPLEMFTTSVAVAVAAIPEGLVVTLTVILALGMQRILKRKAIVRKLLAAETLGSVSVICADKTGTLTEGKLQVVQAESLDEALLVKAAVLCNDRRDPLETAMMEWSEKKLGKEAIKKLRERCERLDEKPFSPETKLIATLHPGLLLVSGAPEVVLARTNLKQKAVWQKKFENYGQKSYRLVGFAYKKVTSAKLKVSSSDLQALNWLGVLVYEDPVRETVKTALAECQKAGIKVKVITGDYLPTALAVLEKLGLSGGDHALTGDELTQLTPVALRQEVSEVVLFARTNPEQKLKIVQALKDNGEVVAMTGDGVNDAPALKRADIGIVVGEASDVAKQTADMVLLDSNFATIVHAIEEGRTIFENIKKVILYLLSDSFTEIILIGGSLFLKLPLPVTAAQILWVNLIEDTFPGVALAFEPEEKEVMMEKPRPRQAPLLDRELKVLIFVIGLLLNLALLGLFYWLSKGTLHLHYIQTVMFAALGIDSIFIAFSCRSLRKTIFHYNPFGNKMLTAAVLVGLLMLVGAVYLPFLQKLLKTHALGASEWTFLLALGTLSLLAVEVTKWIFGRIRKAT